MSERDVRGAAGEVDEAGDALAPAPDGAPPLRTRRAWSSRSIDAGSIEKSKM
jgi:hypothetical protein